MKTQIIILTVLFTFGLSSQMYSNETFDGNKKIKNKLGQYMYFPDFLKHKNTNTTVVVDFQVDKNGGIQINAIGGDPELQEFVVNQLSKISFKKDKNLIGKNFQYKLSFKKE